jgi:hypothetical protein
VALLAYTGTGDEQTDIVAHLTGFLAGAAGGVVLYGLGSGARIRPGVQAAAAVLAALTLAAAWLMALSRA